MFAKSGSNNPCCICWPDAPGNLGALLALDHAKVILTLQV
jgi:hypothetical protein